MSIERDLTHNIWGSVALFLEQVHPFAQASKACKKIAEDSLYPAFWREYLKLGHLKPYAEKFESLPRNAAKVRALFKTLLKEIRTIGGGEKYLASLKKPTVSLLPARPRDLADWIVHEKDGCLVKMLATQENIRKMVPFLNGIGSRGPHWFRPNSEWAKIGEDAHEWVRTDGARLSAIKRYEGEGMSLTIIPQQFMLFVSLTHLDLQENDLVEIPEFLGSLRSLTFLNLAQNKLKRIPASLANLHALRELWLNLNKLTTLPAEMANLRGLEKLLLEDNPLKRVPRALKNSDIPAIRDNPEIKQAVEIPPTLCEQVCEWFWSVWSWLADNAKAFFRLLFG